MNHKLLFLFTLLFFSCKQVEKYSPNNLKKLSNQELLKRAENKTLFQIKDAVFKNEKGEIISLDSIRKISNHQEFTTDRYVNNEGVIKEIILRKASEEDKNLQKELLQLYSKKPPIKTIDIDCENLINILNEINLSDQNMRTGSSKYNPEVDKENLVKVISIIKNCGFPTLNKVKQEGINTIWLVFQHADNDNRKKYFPMLKNAAEKGELKMSQIAIMEDRILLMDGEQQVYGSQIKQNNETGKMEIYSLKNPESVDLRRAKVGLGPLKEYVKNWGIEFTIPQKK